MTRRAATLGPGRRREPGRRGEQAKSGGRRLEGRAGAWIKSLPYLPKWLLLGGLIGVIAGVGAIVFYEALSLATHFFLGFLAGYHAPMPAGAGGAAGGGGGDAGFARPWAIPLVTAAGALLAGFLVFTWAPEAEGHGTDAAIDAVHRNPRGIRARAVVIKIIASALTIGSGGSGGREGPTAQISAGFGSLLARIGDLSPEDGRIAVSVGVGSGIGAIFGAPLGGAVLAADIVYRDDFEAEALLPGLFSSVVAWGVFGAVLGYRPLFAMPSYHFHQPLQLVWFAVLGVAAGFAGLLYSKSFYGITDLSKRLPFTRKLRPAVGAVGVGLLALVLPQVLSTGYGWIQEGLWNQLSHLPLIVVLALPFARILATSLSIGTGGSGGVFGPGMLIGAFTGLALWRLLAPVAPAMGSSPAPFMVVGMMALFGGIARAPLANVLMVAEMTGSVQIIGPAMVAVAISTLIVRRFDDSIYRSQIRSRSDSTASQLRSGLALLDVRPASSAAIPPPLVLRTGQPARVALEALRTARILGAPVTDSDGIYLGTVGRDRLIRAVETDRSATVDRCVDTTAGTVSATADLSEAIDALISGGGQWVTVTDDERRVTGILTAGAVVRGYRDAVRASEVTFSVDEA
ncbi:MAG: chloride channel protein [Nocardiopsaceae bacterium]|nr:chloride channel protein [Nocardiopsaceae bacterium]